ncbi:branched-chain amino acid aminotransferase [Pelagibius sp. CAU 1746]|uniref:branched-chain amino acid aminotransferase n=1 Tax=Pelagibius sp. CAU 1746 TaxID=3140370 RepID=UPI00325B8629
MTAPKAVHFLDGEWVEGNPPIMGPMTHAAWMASVVFDGARAFEGVTPDLDRHCERLVNSANTFGLKALHSAGEMLEIAQDGLRHFDDDAALYLRPMFFAESGFVAADPESTRFCFTLYEAPLPPADGFSVCLSSYRRPAPNMAPTDAKASCLYPNSARALTEAGQRGFDNAVVLDAIGNVAELATANIWIAKDGAAITPVPNGTFLNGVTRQRIMQLLQERGIRVHEGRVTWQDVLEADEVFSTGNYGKVVPITKVEDRNLQPGPVYTTAREAYWDWAHG